MASHDIGDTVTLWASFRDATGAQAAPTTVTLIVQRPADPDTFVVPNGAADASDETRAEAALGVTLSGVAGVYLGDLTVDTTGVWRYEWLGEGAIAERQAGWFEVNHRWLTDPPGTLQPATAAVSGEFTGTSVGP